MRKVFIISLIVLLSSCATVSRRGGTIKVSTSDYIDIAGFCKKCNFEYSFDTIDDLIRIYSPDTPKGMTSPKEIKLLLNSSVGILGGSIFYLRKPPVCLQGKIFLPRQLKKIIASGEFVSFRPLFAIKTIVVDPGHGGKDPGAISAGGLMEKTINLTVSKYLKGELEKMGFKVILTRNRDVFLSLAERTNIAKQCNADLFISIHANANHSRKVSGIEVYYLDPLRLMAMDRSVRLAKSENFQGRNMSFEVKTILWDLSITKNYGFSVEVSDILYLTFKNLGFNVKPPRKAPFYVLRFAYVPSVLFEMGYLSNYYEEKVLRKKHYQKRIARTIALSISSLKRRYAVSNNEDYVYPLEKKISLTEQTNSN